MISDKTVQRLSKTMSSEDKVAFYQKHLQILNSLLEDKNRRLTEKEIEVLALFMCEPLDYRFSTEARKKVMDAMNLSRAGVSNYLTQLLRKGYLQSVNTRMKYAIHPSIEPTSDHLNYNLTLEYKYQ